MWNYMTRFATYYLNQYETILMYLELQTARSAVQDKHVDAVDALRVSGYPYSFGCVYITQIIILQFEMNFVWVGTWDLGLKKKKKKKRVEWNILTNCNFKLLQFEISETQVVKERWVKLR